MSFDEQNLTADSIKDADENSPVGGSMHMYGSTDKHLRPRTAKKEKTTWADSKDESKKQYINDSIQAADDRSLESSHRSSIFNDEIDGRFSVCDGNLDDYVRVEINTDATSISHELKKCKRTVMKPYLIFLKVIGWRRLRESEKDSGRRRLHSFLNVVYPMFIFLMLTATIIIQQLTCFNRTSPANYRYKNNGERNHSHLLISCSKHIVSYQVVEGVLILCAYLYGIYLFRYGEPEHLSALIERVFLSCSQQINGSKRKIIWVLRSYLVLGSLWILLDFTLNGARMYSLQLLERDSFNPSLLIPPGRHFNGTSIHTTEENILRYALVLFLPFGFAVYDVLYFAVVVAYASQCQLIQCFITSIMEKVRTKAYSLEDAIKDIRQTYTYLDVLNSSLSTLTSFILFVFLLNTLLSIDSLAKFPEMDSFQKSPVFYVGVIVGLGNIFQWIILAAVPLVQAARLTAQCIQLWRLGLEIASRPFMYEATPPFDLIYFLMYTNTSRYTAKLAAVPVYPWMVVGSLFLGGIIGCFIIITDSNHFLFARWF